MICLGRLQPSEIKDIERLSRARPVTYPEVSATTQAVLPVGYQHVRESVMIGRDDDALGRGRAALRAWAAHTHIGAKVTPVSAPIEQGMTVIVTVPIGPLTVVAPCRIG